MTAKNASPILLFVLLSTVQLACNLAGGGPGTPDTVATLNGLYTSAAQTSTAAASSATPGLPLPTGTSGTPVTSTAVNTQPPVARCDAAAFVRDVTVPDGSVLSRNTGFTKTWRLQNVGTCTWTSAYRVVFVSGAGMNGPSSATLPGSVNPGQTIDVSVNLTSPGSDGHYRGYWKLRNTSNALFGIGSNADTAFWVDVNVKGPSFAAYDFVANYCEAEWENNNSALPCPGNEGANSGYVIKLNAPRMENDEKSQDPGLVTYPKSSNNGFIAGTYPAFQVKSGDRFRALINCRRNADRCNVTFRLDYRTAGQTKTFATWHEIYEGKYFPIDLDLSSLAGKNIKFILVVTANGQAQEDEALWVAPRIVRQGSPPAASSTPIPFTATPTLTATSTPTSTPTATETHTPTPTPTP
jgi:hypothetical protein